MPQEYRIDAAKLDRLEKALTRAEELINASPYRMAITAHPAYVEGLAAFRDVRVTLYAQRSTETKLDPGWQNP